MTKRREREWLSDIISWRERLQDHLSGIDREAFFGSILIQDAASKCVEAIGEAAGTSMILIRNWTGMFLILI
jgi:uncharacterized protein with HEPN domain